VSCEHKDFNARVSVNRLEDTGRFSADIRIQCAACKEPFRFLGVEAGSSPFEPKVSIDGLELRAPIEPQGTPKIASGAQFVMPPLPPKVDS
jgi:hypothetical protein